MQILDGQKIADEILGRLKQTPAPKKFMAGFVVGRDAAALSFQQIKKKTGETLGVDYRIYELPEDSTNDSAREAVGKIAKSGACGGVLVQLPLPPHLNRHYVLNAIPQEKDLDVIGERALGAFYANRNKVLPPAVGTFLEILNRFPLLTKEGLGVVDKPLPTLPFERGGGRIAIVGPGFLVGRPIATYLMNNHVRDLTIIGRGGDLSRLKEADIVILGAGQAGMVKPDMLKPGAGVIDFSYSRSDDGKLVGDFDASSLSEGELKTLNFKLPTFYTPTPGGTGPILVAKLFENFYALNLPPLSEGR